MADFTSRFNELLSRASKPDAEIADDLGVSKQTISAWKNGVRFPKKPAIRIIADYFGVGVPWLTGVTNDMQAAASKVQNSTAPALPPDPHEAELLQIYRDLNPRGQETLLGTARGLHNNPKMKNASASNTTAI